MSTNFTEIYIDVIYSFTWFNQRISRLVAWNNALATNRLENGWLQTLGYMSAIFKEKVSKHNLYVHRVLLHSSLFIFVYAWTCGQ